MRIGTWNNSKYGCEQEKNILCNCSSMKMRKKTYT